MADVCTLVDAVGGTRYRNLDFGGVVEYLLGEFFDFRGHGGTEHQGLTLLGQASDNLHYVVIKSHIEHSVGFVEYEE